MRERRDERFRTTGPAGITPARAGKTSCAGCFMIVCRDHPRSCRKDDVPMVDASIPLGSPPLVRERPGRRLHTGPEIGITPAHAGKTERLTLILSRG